MPAFFISGIIGKWNIMKIIYDEKALKKIVEGISYNNAVRYFGFDL